MSFMRSTFDADGFPRNYGVGHGWVEGGPLLPVRTEFYQAGLYVEALRSMAMLARHIGDQGLAARLDQEFQAKKRSLNQLFWLPGIEVVGLRHGRKSARRPAQRACHGSDVVWARGARSNRAK